MDTEEIINVEELARKVRDNIRQRRKINLKKHKNLVFKSKKISINNRPIQKNKTNIVHNKDCINR